MKNPVADTQCGFTLVEALVAVVLVGVALALVIGGLGRPSFFLAKADLHASARELAVQKLDEFTLSVGNQISDQDEQFLFRGVKFGYKLRFNPVDESDVLPVAGTPLAGKLLAVEIDVYWGEPPLSQSLSLQTLVMRP